MSTRDQQKYPAASKPGSQSESDLDILLRNLDRKSVFDLATSMYLDYADESYIAKTLSELYGVAFEPNMIRRLRFEAAMEADGLDSPQDRKKWIFRYSNLTVNNLIKEYMFIMRSPNFYEAKVELADELFWLQQKFSRKKLWVALNDAVGRNNVPIEIVDELIEFRETMSHIKQVLADSARQKKEDPTLLLLDISKKAEAAYNGQCEQDILRTGDYVCEQLGIERGLLAPADIKFLREYFRCSRFPNRTDENSLVKLIEGADALHKRNLLKEAAAGNAANFTPSELHLLAQKLRTGPLLKPDQLGKIGEFASRKLRSCGTDSIVAKLKETIEDHLRLRDIGCFYSSGELLKLRFQGVSGEELREMLDTLNALSKIEEVRSYAARTGGSSSRAKIIESFVSRYCKIRFGVASV